METQTEVVPINRKQRRAANAMARHGAEGRAVIQLPEGLNAALNTEQAAAYTGLAVATLEGLRSKGGGACFVRYGRKAVRYRLADLDAWMAERTVANTSQAAA